MTHTVQSHCKTAIVNTIDNAGNIGKPETVENPADFTIREILSVCDSLNRLCETLSRLEYALKRKNIEKGLTKGI